MARTGYALRIKDRIQRLEDLISAAQVELDELRVAERVLNRLGADDNEKGPDDGQYGTPATRGGTIIDMAVDCLKKIGPSDTTSILRSLRESWRADLKATTLASTLSRAKAEGRIKSVNGVWHVIHQEMLEPPEGGSTEIDSAVDAAIVDDDGRELI